VQQPLLYLFSYGWVFGADSSDDILKIEQDCKSIDQAIEKKKLSSKAFADVGS
jgi:hypothetical protein